MRMRDDKPDGNHKSIVTKILQSIKDGVELEAVSQPLNLISIRTGLMIAINQGGLDQRGLESQRSAEAGSGSGPAAAASAQAGGSRARGFFWEIGRRICPASYDWWTKEVVCGVGTGLGNPGHFRCCIQ